MFELNFKIDIDGSDLKTTRKVFEELGEDYKAFHLTYAREALKGEIRKGFPRTFLTRVDGKINADPIDVKPFGKIQFINTSVDVGELIYKSYLEIRERSPRGGSKDSFPGVKYKDWNWILLNDRVVAKSRMAALRFTDNIGKFIKDGDKVTFINVVPYARKLERFGITRSTRGKFKGSTVKKGRKKSKGSGFVNVPRGTYAGAQRVIKGLFTGKAIVPNVKFIPFNISVEGMRSTFSIKGTGVNQKPGRPYLYPVIDVIINASGFRGVVQ